MRRTTTFRKLHGSFLLALVIAAPTAALTNPAFLVTDPADPNFGWETRGAVSVIDGAAVLQEDDRVLTRLSQTFTIPQDAKTLRFTIVGANLTARDPLQPPDAFEVALLDASTSAPLAGTAAGLSDTDSFLNLQPNGEVFFSPKVKVPGATSGQVASLQFPLTAEVDLRGIAAGTRATLSFDLLGFRPLGSSVTIDNVFVMRDGAIPPVVVSGGPYSGLINQPIAFDGGGSSDPDSPILLYEWDFESDGVFDVSSGSLTATHAYSSAGTFTVTLRLTDDTGLTATSTASVVIRPLNRPPVAVPQGPATAREGEKVAFSGTGSSDPDNDPLTFAWTFGDGGSAGGANPIHPFTDNGTYSVRLTVTDPGGLMDSKVLSVVVSNGAPAVDAGRDGSIVQGATLASTGRFTDFGADTWTATVDYGDGSGVQPLALRPDKTFDLTHLYKSAGSFTVTVTVADDDGGASSDAAVVTVQPGSRPPVCSAAKPSADRLWPPNHKYATIQVQGVTDPDKDPVKIVVDRIRQDEPVNGTGDGDTAPDGEGVGTATARMRAERAGTGNGRVYHIFFTATDGKGGTCSGEVLVGVPHDQGQGSVPVDDGPLFDSTVL